MKHRKFIKISLISAGILLIAAGITALLLIKYSNRIVKSVLESRFGQLVTVEKIDLKWNQVDVFDIHLKNDQAKDIIKVEHLSLKADFMGLFRKAYTISELSIKNPYLLVELDKKGILVSPRLPALPPSETSKTPPTAILFKKISVTGGAIDYLDRKAPGGPVSLEVRDVELVISNVTLPASDDPSVYDLKAALYGKNGKGIVKSRGEIHLKTLDFKGKLEAHRIDIVEFNPYLSKKGGIHVTKGFLDLNMDAKIASKKIDAPSRAILSDLAFSSGSGFGNTIFDAPITAVVSFLKDNKNEIVVDFVLKGDLDNPRVSLMEDFTGQLVSAISQKVGGTVKGVGESMLEGIKKIGKGVENLFKKR